MQKDKWAVVENAGYEGENIRTTCGGYIVACNYLGRNYSTDERERLHVAVARILDNGELTYEY